MAKLVRTCENRVEADANLASNFIFFSRLNSPVHAERGHAHVHSPNPGLGGDYRPNRRPAGAVIAHNKLLAAHRGPPRQLPDDEASGGRRRIPLIAVCLDDRALESSIHGRHFDGPASSPHPRMKMRTCTPLLRKWMHICTREKGGHVSPC
jgi:hypothetical protein